jgi:hypothetical protein
MASATLAVLSRFLTGDETVMGEERPTSVDPEKAVCRIT